MLLVDNQGWLGTVITPTNAPPLALHRTTRPAVSTPQFFWDGVVRKRPAGNQTVLTIQIGRHCGTGQAGSAVFREISLARQSRWHSGREGVRCGYSGPFLRPIEK